MSIKAPQFGVSIRLMTYNHEAYIRQAMDGIMSQKTNFKVEVVVGDDFSPDKTLDIIRTYRNTEKITINILNREKGDEYWKKRQQRGRLYNFQNIIENCAGKYIALLDGDDYWNDELKLQKQFDFMQAHSNCSVCFTSALFFNESDEKKSFTYYPRGISENKVFTLSQAIYKSGDLMPTASILFRQKFVSEIPDWVFTSPVGDMPLSLFLGTKGDYGYLSDVTAVYRVQAAGSWSAQMSFERRRKQVQGFLKTLDEFNSYTNQKYSSIIKKEQRRIRFNDRKSVVKRAVAQTAFGSWLKYRLDL